MTHEHSGRDTSVRGTPRPGSSQLAARGSSRPWVACAVVALGLTTGCSIDKGDVEFVPDAVFDANGAAGAAGSSGSAGTGGTSGSGGSGGASGKAGGAGVSGAAGAAGTAGQGGGAGTAGAAGAAGKGGAGGGGAGGNAGSSGKGGSNQCGDSAVQVGEECDGANLVNQTCATVTQNKLPLGTLKCSATCKFDTSGCSSPCGNGQIDTGEECDGATVPSASTCATLVGTGSTGTVGCTAACKFDVAKCTPPVGCGDGVITGTEACDGQNFGTRTCASETGDPKAGGSLACTSLCKIDKSKCTSCGDGIVQSTEQCDGSVPAAITCATQVGPGSTGTVTCAACKLNVAGCSALQTCGNGALDAGEPCDGAKIATGKSCATETGAADATGSLACSATCTLDASGCASCSDGKKNGSESDLDCGGTCATKCALGKACGAAGDCVAGACVTSVCHDFAASFAQSTVNVVRGGSTTATLLLDRKVGFPGGIDVTAGTLPAGVTITLSPASPVLGVATTVTVATTAATPLGSQSLTFSASASGLTRTAVLAVEVAAPAGNITAVSTSLGGNEVPQGTTSVTLSLSGTNLTGATAVQLDAPSGPTCTIVSQSDTDIGCTFDMPHGTPLGAGDAKRLVPITVSLPGGQAAGGSDKLFVTPLYVSAAVGSDGNRGTSAAPLKTLGYALTANGGAQAGDVISAEGTFTAEPFPLAVPAGVAITSVNRATIKGSKTLDAFAPLGSFDPAVPTRIQNMDIDTVRYCVRAVSTGDLSLIDLGCSNTSDNGYGFHNAMRVYMEGSPTAQTCKISEVAYSAVYLTDNAELIARNCHVQGITYVGYYGANTTKLTVDGGTINDCGRKNAGYYGDLTSVLSKDSAHVTLKGGLTIQSPNSNSFALYHVGNASTTLDNVAFLGGPGKGPGIYHQGADLIGNQVTFDGVGIIAYSGLAGAATRFRNSTWKNSQLAWGGWNMSLDLGVAGDPGNNQFIDGGGADGQLYDFRDPASGGFYPVPGQLTVATQCVGCTFIHGSTPETYTGLRTGPAQGGGTAASPSWKVAKAGSAIQF